MVRINKLKIFLIKIVIIPIRIYQLIISPMLGSNKCCFYPTCSNYAILAIKEKGIMKGIALSILRILKCHPWSNGGHDPVIKDKN